MIYFYCEEIGYIATRCPNKEIKDEKKNNNHKGKKDSNNYKNYKDKGKKSCFIAKVPDNSEDEMVYDEGDKMALISHVRKIDT